MQICMFCHGLRQVEAADNLKSTWQECCNVQIKHGKPIEQDGANEGVPDV